MRGSSAAEESVNLCNIIFAKTKKKRMVREKNGNGISHTSVGEGFGSKGEKKS